MRIRKTDEQTGKKKRSGKKLAAAAAAAVVLTAGAAVHERFSVEELLRSPDSQTPVTAFEQTPAAGESVIAELPAEERKLSRSDAVRSRILRLPVWVKAAALLPLWAAGTLPAALAAALGPVWRALLGFAVQAAVLAGLFCLAYKLLFPKRKVRELFRKKNLRRLLLGAVVLTAADMVLAMAWPEWTAARAVLMLGLGFGVLCLLWKRLCGAFRAPEPETVKTRLVADQAA